MNSETNTGRDARPARPRSRETRDPTSPFFSIIVPCCDVEPYVHECLDSVSNQPFTDWECLIGVETSKDKTEEIVRAYAAKDSRFKVFAGPRSGSCSASRNTGIDRATGEYVIFLDGDDTIAEGSLQRLRDKIAERPGADLYPCAIQVHNDMTGKDEELRDNYPQDFKDELSGPAATIKTERSGKDVCPMLQLTVFRRQFLTDNNLKCIYGLRRQDSEFSPRALYLAKRVVPLHEPFYIYRLQAASVSSSARGEGYFHGDWATIIRSLLAFHAKVSAEPGFDRRIAEIWGRKWTGWIFYFWFDPENVRKIPRARRTETLTSLFAEGFDDFGILMKFLPRARRMAGWWVRAFVRHPVLRGAAELFFRLYFQVAKTRRRRT